jgi:hypothetical protein
MVFVYPASMLDEEFRKQRASLVRDLASRADPFIKKRLLALASRYEDTKNQAAARFARRPGSFPPPEGRRWFRLTI